MNLGGERNQNVHTQQSLDFRLFGQTLAHSSHMDHYERIVVAATCLRSASDGPGVQAGDRVERLGVKLRSERLISETYEVGFVRIGKNCPCIQTRKQWPKCFTLFDPPWYAVRSGNAKLGSDWPSATPLF